MQSLQLLHSPALLLPGEILGLRKIPGAKLYERPRRGVILPLESQPQIILCPWPSQISGFPVPPGWVSLPETGKAPPLLPCSTWAVQGPGTLAVHPGSSAS